MQRIRGRVRSLEDAEDGRVVAVQRRRRIPLPRLNEGSASMNGHHQSCRSCQSCQSFPPVTYQATLTGKGHVDGELCAHTGHHLEPHQQRSLRIRDGTRTASQPVHARHVHRVRQNVNLSVKRAIRPPRQEYCTLNFPAVVAGAAFPYLPPATTACMHAEDARAHAIC